MKLARVLGELAAVLDAQGMPYAVVGGLAASIHGEARFTRDINVALMVENDEEAEQCIHGFILKGYALVATVEQDATHRLATARLRHPDGIVCDLIFATCGIERDIVASAQRIELFSGTWVTNRKGGIDDCDEGAIRLTATSPRFRGYSSNAAGSSNAKRSSRGIRARIDYGPRLRARARAHREVAKTSG